MTSAQGGGADHQWAFIICTDNHYASHAGTCLFSLFLSTPRRDFDVHVIANQVSDEQQSRFRRLASIFGATIFVHDPGNSLQTLRCHNDDYLKYKLPHVSEATMLRLYYHVVIPRTYERVVYIDCDVVFVRDAFQLFTVDLGECTLAAAPDLILNEHLSGNQALQSRYPYFNSGVLLIDDDKWRRENVISSLESILARADPKQLTYLDQHLLNVHFQSVGYHVLPYNYNYQYMATIDGVKSPPAISIEAACVIHYAGEIKPWYEWAPEAYAYWYLVYRRASPWGADYQPEKPSKGRHLLVGYRTLIAQGRHELACNYADALIKILQQQSARAR